MKTATGTTRIFAARKVTRADAGGELFAPVDQFGEESGDTPSYDVNAVASRCVELNAPVMKSLAEKVPAPQDWRDKPTKTYRWGAIEFQPAGYPACRQRFFKTQVRAREYGRANFKRYVVGDHWDFS